MGRGSQRKRGDHKADDSLDGNAGFREHLFYASLWCSGARAGMPVPKPLLGEPLIVLEALMWSGPVSVSIAASFCFQFGGGAGWGSLGQAL